MPKANLYDMAGKQIGEIELSEAIFGIEPNEDVYKRQVFSPRRGTENSMISPAISPWTGRTRPSGSVRTALAEAVPSGRWKAAIRARVSSSWGRGMEVGK